MIFPVWGYGKSTQNDSKMNDYSKSTAIPLAQNDHTAYYEIKRKYIMKIIALVLLFLTLCSCQGIRSAYLPSGIRSGTDIAISALLEEKVLRPVQANEIHTKLTQIIKNKDLTPILYNEKLQAVLREYPGANQIAFALLILSGEKIDQVMSPAQYYLLEQALNQYALAVREWERWQNVK